MPLADVTPREPLAWFADSTGDGSTGLLATGLVELGDELSALDDGAFWALVVDAEGGITCARFADVVPAPLPAAHAPWQGLAGEWSTSLDEGAYVAACRDVRRRIAAGEVYQVNVCRVLEHSLDDGADVLALAARTTRGNPAPYASLVRLPGTEVVCASPELLLERHGSTVTTGPIKGTAPTVDQLLPKDVHENVMIVDLARNDLSVVCAPGSVRVPDLLRTQEHPGLVHLVSRVSGELRARARWADVLAAVLPAASVTGAPKSTALAAIADLEPVARGPYCGAIGWVHGDRCRLAVGIRTFWTAQDAVGRRVLRFGTGAGITWGSDPLGEWRETELKASRLIGLANGVPALAL
ncbi:MAG TPA: chorismate-binding protein [Actinomycetales bacterium]|nr:chorismate-binding protein [Actinomycetales bacterium]